MAGTSSTSHFALVLPGAVARGAYEAGVIEVLANSDIKIDRIVATSSGALNGLAYAAGIRGGREKEMAERLAQAWIKNGSWENSLNLNLWGLIRGRGISSKHGLMNLMKDMIQPCTNPVKIPVEFRVITTPLNGVVSRIGKNPATSYETVLKFADEDFDTQEGLDRIFNAVSAACAFPGLFEPVDVPGLGACVDGGAVNNAPIRYALEESDVNRVIMPVPYPAVMPPGDWTNSFSLLNHLIEILINERLFRDLKEGQNVNQEALALDDLLAKGVLNADQVEAVKNALQIRKVDITEIRPEEAFKTSPFAGFFHQNDRKQLIEDGKNAALRVLSMLPKTNPEGIQTT